MTDDASRNESFCISCRHSLRGVSSRACPECGRAFDPDDPRTTAAHRLRGVWIGLSYAGRLLVIGSGLLAALGFIVSALGFDPLFLWLGAFSAAPVLLFMLVVVALPAVPLSRRIRLMGIVFTLLIISIVWTQWPFSVTFALHRPAMERVVERVRSGGAVSGPARIGVYGFRQVRRIPNGNIGFQLTGGDGGGCYLVWREPSSAWVWNNTNWESDLGDGWYHVYQD